MYCVDLHTHTLHYSGCGHQTIEELIEAAVEAGLHAVCVTEHRFKWPDEHLREVVERMGLSERISVLAGEEIACYGPDGSKQGDWLVFGLPWTIGEDMDVFELAELVHRSGGIIIAAHPFREGYFNPDTFPRVPMDAIEALTKNHPPELAAKSIEFSRRTGVPLVNASDGHRAEQVGMYATLFPEPVREVGDIIRQIREKKVRAELPRSLLAAAGQ